MGGNGSKAVNGDGFMRNDGYASLGDGVWARMVDGLPHAVGGPAVIVKDAGGKPLERMFMRKGVLHNPNGPAVEVNEGDYCASDFPGHEDWVPVEWRLGGEPSGPTLRDVVRGVVETTGGNRFTRGTNLWKALHAKGLDGSVSVNGSGEVDNKKDPAVHVWNDHGAEIEMYYERNVLHREMKPAVTYRGVHGFLTPEWWEHGQRVSQPSNAMLMSHAATVVSDVIAAKWAKDKKKAA